MRARVALLVLAGLPLAGCRLPSRPSIDATQALAEVEPGAAWPVDVAVARVENRTGVAGVPVARVRRALYEGLLERLYSSLALEFVDARWVDASWSDSVERLGADGILVVAITEWNTDQLRTHGAIVVRAEAQLLEAGAESSDGAVPAGASEAGDAAGGPRRLWGFDVVRRIQLPRGLDAEAAGAMLAAEVLALLPEREPRVAVP